MFYAPLVKAEQPSSDAVLNENLIVLLPREIGVDLSTDRIAMAGKITELVKAERCCNRCSADFENQPNTLVGDEIFGLVQVQCVDDKRRRIAFGDLSGRRDQLYCDIDGLNPVKQETMLFFGVDPDSNAIATRNNHWDFASFKLCNHSFCLSDGVTNSPSLSEAKAGGASSSTREGGSA